MAAKAQAPDFSQANGCSAAPQGPKNSLIGADKNATVFNQI
jgi:hypothetical protein